jgi:hypothetical protein
MQRCDPFTTALSDECRRVYVPHAVKVSVQGLLSTHPPQGESIADISSPGPMSCGWNKLTVADSRRIDVFQRLMPRESKLTVATFTPVFMGIDSSLAFVCSPGALHDVIGCCGGPCQSVGIRCICNASRGATGS